MTTSDTAPNPAVAALLVMGLVATALVGAPLQFVPPETIKAATASAVIAATLALWAWRLEPRVPLRWSAYLLAPFGLACLGVLSAAWSPVTTAVVDSIRWLFIGTAIFLGLNSFGRDSFGAIARAAHWSALILSLMALAEFWFEFSWFPTEAPPGANFGNRNFFAEFIATALPFSLWMLLRPGTPNRAAFSGLGCGIILVALMSTGTRSALFAAGLCIALALGIFSAFVARSEEARPQARTLLAAFVPALLAILALGWLPTSNSTIVKEGRGLTPVERTVNRMRSLGSPETYEPGSSFGTRLEGWETGKKMVLDHPLRGVGAGGWNTVSALYTPESQDMEVVWLAHNEPLQLVAEYGLAGWAALLALAGLVLGAARVVARQLMRGERVQDAFQDTIVVLSVGAFGVVSLSGLPLHASTTCYLLALGVGYLLAIRPGREFAIGTGAAAPLMAGRIATVVLLMATAVACVQGMRSAYLVQRGGGLLTGLAGQTLNAGGSAAQVRDKAVADLRAGYAIFSDHGLATPRLVTLLGQMGDPNSALWLASVGLETRPHVAALRCDMARAYSDLGNFAAAAQTLDAIEKSRPGATCLALMRLDYEYKQGHFPKVVEDGQKLLATMGTKAKPNSARFALETTYRAALRVPDIDAAAALLRLRAERWPELRTGSWMLMGQLYASRTPGQVVTPAVDAFRQSLSFATPQERQQILAAMPPIYRPLMN